MTPGLTYEAAASRLADLGFSSYGDIPRMLTSARKGLGLPAYGLTSTAQVLVTCRSGRYRVELARRGRGPAPCRWTKENDWLPFPD